MPACRGITAPTWMELESGTLCQLDDHRLSWSNIYDKNVKGSSDTDDRGGQLKLSGSGRMAVVYNPSSLTVHNLTSDPTAVSIDGLVGIKWAGWCPQSHLDNHLTVLCSSGRMFLYRMEVSLTTSLRAVLQCATRVNSSEDATLLPVSAAHSHDSVWVLLENGDVLKVSPWLPIPALIPKSLVTDSMAVSSTDHDLALVTGVNGAPRIGPPCLIQPEPLEPTGQYKEIQAVSYRGIDLLFVSCGQTRIDVLLVVEESDRAPLLVLLESIELTNPPRQTDQLAMRPFPSTSQPALLIQQGSQVFAVRLTWAEQLVDSIIYDVNIDLIQSKVNLVSTDLQAAFPLVSALDGSLSCLAVINGEHRIVQLEDNGIAPPAIREAKLSSSLPDILDKKPTHTPYEPLVSVEFKASSLPEDIKDLRLPDLTEDSLVSLLDSAVDPLRGDSIASLVAASSALLGILEQIDGAIEKQGNWLAELNGRLEAHLTAMLGMQEKMGKASERWTSLQNRHQSILERLQSGPMHSEGNPALLERLRALTELITPGQEAKTPNKLDDEEIRQGAPISASIKDLCLRVARLAT